MTYLYRVTLDPIDPMLFGDSRPARAGFDAVQAAQDPSPLVFHGALGATVVRATGATLRNWSPAKGILGPQKAEILNAASGSVAELLGLALHGSLPDGDLLFPKPRHFRVQRSIYKGTLSSVGLLSPIGGICSSCRYDQVLEEKSKPSAGFEEEEGPLWISRGLLGHLLQGKDPSDSLNSAMRAPEDLYREELRLGITIANRHGTAMKGRLFTRPYRRFGPPAASTFHGSGTTAWFQTLGSLDNVRPQDLNEGFLGGDRGRVRMTWTREEDLLPFTDLLQKVLESGLETSKGFIAYLLTPMILSEVSKPKIEDHCPIAAAVARPRYISGWNSALNSPRPIVALVPEGSVYFFEWPDQAQTAEVRSEIVRRNWTASLNGLGAPAGFGRILLGVWS